MSRALEDARTLAKTVAMILRKETGFTNEERLEVAEILTDVVCLGCGKLLPEDLGPCDCGSPTPEEKLEVVIVCKVCGSEHDPATPFEDSLQGNDCAASIQEHPEYGWVLIGSYGSTLVDTKMYKVLDETLQVVTEPVCDGCIGGWIRSGRVELLREDVF